MRLGFTVFFARLRPRTHTHTISRDRTIYEDTVFARMLRDSGLMTDRDFNCCASMSCSRSLYLRRVTSISDSLALSLFTLSLLFLPSHRYGTFQQYVKLHEKAKHHRSS